MSKLFSNISKSFKIKKINSTAYHPETNGALERSHSTLINYLKNYINIYQCDWDNSLDFAIFSYNTTVHTSTKFPPFELVFGNKARIPSHLAHDPIFKYTYDDYLDELTLKCQKSHQLAKDAEYYNDGIKMVNSGEKQFMELLKDQLQVVQTTIHNFNNSIININVNNKLFDENIQKIRKYISENNENYFGIARKQTIEEHLSLPTLIVEETDKELNNVIDSILFAKNNLLHSIIITSNQYINELTKSMAYLPILYSYAYPLKLENAFQLMSLTKL